MANVTLQSIRQKAIELGWDDVGTTFAKISEEDISAYLDWLDENCQGPLEYMKNRVRCDPQAIFPGAKTAILFVSYYKQESLAPSTDTPLIASYARGRDYHLVHRKRLKNFILWLEEMHGESNIAKGFSDSTPLLEKALAVQAGLGWFGKNTLLIHRRFGTFVLLSGILTTLELPYPPPPLRIPRCGTCTRCLDACPTQALKPYQLDANLCLSTHLIESKGALPPDIQQKNPGYAFGCDRCQDACPHNLRKPIAEALEFSPEQGIGTCLTQEKMAFLREQPHLLFGTPLQRRGIPGLMHNLGMPV